MATLFLDLSWLGYPGLFLSVLIGAPISGSRGALLSFYILFLSKTSKSDLSTVYLDFPFPSFVLHSMPISLSTAFSCGSIHRCVYVRILPSLCNT